MLQVQRYLTFIDYRKLNCVTANQSDLLMVITAIILLPNRLLRSSYTDQLLLTSPSQLVVLSMAASAALSEACSACRAGK